jgi:hypothetical protein
MAQTREQAKRPFSPIRATSLAGLSELPEILQAAPPFHARQEYARSLWIRLQSGEITVR